MRGLLIVAGLGVTATGPCKWAREIDKQSLDDLTSAETVCAASPWGRGCLVHAGCSLTNAPCSAANPLFVPRYADEGNPRPFRRVLGGIAPMPSVADGKVQARVIPPEVWWRLPTAVVLYERLEVDRDSRI